MKKTFLYLVLSILVAVVVILTTVVLYETFFLKSTQQDSIATSESSPIIEKKKVLLETTKITIPVQEKTDVLSIATEVEDYKHSQKHKDKNVSKPLLKPSCDIVVQKPKKVKKVYHDGVARLAIIMDDIASARQVRQIKEIPFSITPSIFPSTSSHPNTPQYAKSFKCYMVHLPMEAFNFSREEENTLRITDSLQVIEEKVASMHQDFPDAIAVNNHTGSKFTSDSEAMDRLFCILDKYDIAFVDSKTAPHTKSQEVAKLHNKVVLERHVFLDNEPDVDYILNQLKKAIQYAKRHGSAIAICHPRPETFEALKEASTLLDGVKMVYIDELL